MLTLSVIELQRTGNGVQDGSGDTRTAPAFEPHVVVHADSIELGDFLTPETGNPARPRVRTRTCLLRCDAGPAGPQELQKVGLGYALAHLSQVSAGGVGREGRGVRGSAVPPVRRTPGTARPFRMSAPVVIWTCRKSPTKHEMPSGLRAPRCPLSTAYILIRLEFIMEHPTSSLTARSCW